MTVATEGEAISTVFEKFVMAGDDRNLIRVHAKGRFVEDSTVRST